MDETSVSETLNPEGEREASPGTDEIPGDLPEEDCYSTSSKTSDARCQDKKASESRGRWVHGLQDTELEDQHKADERKRVEADEKE